MEQGCKDTTHCGMTYDAASSAHGIVLAKAIAQKKSYQQLHQHRHQIRKRYNGQHIFLLRAALRHHHPAAAPCSGTMAKLQSQPTQHSESSTLRAAPCSGTQTGLWQQHLATAQRHQHPWSRKLQSANSTLAAAPCSSTKAQTATCSGILQGHPCSSTSNQVPKRKHATLVILEVRSQ